MTILSVMMRVVTIRDRFGLSFDCIASEAVYDELALDPEDFRVLSGLHLFLLMRGKLNDDAVELSMFSQGEAC